MRQRQFVIRGLSYTFLIVASAIMFYPLLYMILGIFTTNEQFVRSVILPIPNTLNLDVFWRAINSGIASAYVNTLVRVVFYLVVNLGVGLVGGFIFSKLQFPGRNRVFLLFLAGMVMPGLLVLVPTYLMMAWWPNTGGNNWLGQGGHGLINDIRVLYVGGWVPPFAIFLLKQSFDMLPNEYGEAAKMDGAGIFTIIFRVYAPLLKPPLVVLTVFAFFAIWNDYLWPQLTINGLDKLYPIMLRYQQVVQTDVSPSGQLIYPSVFIKTLLAGWPPALVYFLLQRYFVQGLVASGIKG